MGNNEYYEHECFYRRIHKDKECTDTCTDKCTDNWNKCGKSDKCAYHSRIRESEYHHAYHTEQTEYYRLNALPYYISAETVVEHSQNVHHA